MTYHDNVTILNKVIIPNDKYWEFSFNENKSQHITGIDMFVHNVPTYYFETRFKYKLIDPIFNKIMVQEQLLGFFGDTIVDGIYIYRNQMMYILKGDTIYGVDLDILDYFEIDEIKSYLITMLTITNPEQLYDDENGDVYAKYNEIFSGYDNLKRYLVVLLSK